MTTSPSSASRTIAIGDVHGCAAELRLLTAQLDLHPNDCLILLGDVVDRGPATRDALDLLFELRSTCQLICLLGNHEQMMLEAVRGGKPLQDWLVHGGAETLDSYEVGGAPQSIDSRHLEFVESWGDYYECPTHFFAHANYKHELALAEQPWEILRWLPYKWNVPLPHLSGKTAVVGHSADKQGRIVNLGHVICIDTFCHGGGWLTALDVASGRVWQANRKGEARQGALPPVQNVGLS